MDAILFTRTLLWNDLPQPVKAQAHRCLLDLVGVGIAGTQTDLSHVIRDHAASQFGGNQIMPLDGRQTSAAGTALLSCQVASLAWAFCFKMCDTIETVFERFEIVWPPGVADLTL